MAGGRRNFFLHGELPLVLLTLVARTPMHGYELMQELARLLAPAYEPSPGSVYPALAALVAEGLVDADPSESRRRSYRITSRGRAVLVERRSAVRSFEVRTGVRLEADDVRSTIERFVERIAPLEERLEPTRVDAVLERAARELERLVESDRRRRGRRV